MTINIISPPVNMPITLTTARNAARVNGTDLDAELEIHVRDLTTIVEQHTGRALITRTYELTMDAFPKSIELPATPVISLTSIKYFDVSGVEQTLPAINYIADTKGQPGRITPGVGLEWPETQDRINAVNVIVVCGYGTDDTNVPQQAKAYIVARLKEIYAPAGTPESPFLVRGLDSLKVYA